MGKVSGMANGEDSGSCTGKSACVVAAFAGEGRYCVGDGRTGVDRPLSMSGDSLDGSGGMVLVKWPWS